MAYDAIPGGSEALVLIHHGLKQLNDQHDLCGHPMWRLSWFMQGTSMLLAVPNLR